MAANEKPTKFALRSLPALGHTIQVVGVATGYRVSLNLMIGNRQDSIGFHFSPRWDEKVIVLNNRDQGSWQKEQRAMKGARFKWHQDSVMSLKFMVDARGVTTWWNGEKLKECYFRHRVDPSTISGMEVIDMHVNQVKVEKHDLSAPNADTHLSFYNIAFRKKNLTIKATPMKARPSINFLAGNSNDNYAIHFSPRFDQKVLVRNNKTNNTWQNEERHLNGGFPWRQSDTCTFNFYIADDRVYFVWGDEEVCQFIHRTSVGEVVGLLMDGMCVHEILVQ